MYLTLDNDRQSSLSRKLDIIIILMLYKQKQNFWKMPSVTELEIRLWDNSIRLSDYQLSVLSTILVCFIIRSFAVSDYSKDVLRSCIFFKM